MLLQQRRRRRFSSTLTACNFCLPHVGETWSDDNEPHVVVYLSDTIMLPCNHTVAKADLEAVAWRKDTETIVGEYDIGDDPPVSFYDSMEGRASLKVFPPALMFSNSSLEDAGVYQCEVFPLVDDPIVFRYIVIVNGRALLYIQTHSPVRYKFGMDCMSSICA